MKLYLSVNKIPPNGYIHLDPNPKDGNFILVKNFVDTIYDLTSFNIEYCSSIIIDEIYSMIPHKEKETFLKNCYNLLVKEGTLILNGKDFLEICKMFLTADIDIHKMNEFLGQSVDEMDNVVNLVKSIGFTITNRELNGINWLLECKK